MDLIDELQEEHREALRRLDGLEEALRGLPAGAGDVRPEAVEATRVLVDIGLVRKVPGPRLAGWVGPGLGPASRACALVLVRGSRPGQVSGSW